MRHTDESLATSLLTRSDSPQLIDEKDIRMIYCRLDADEDVAADIDEDAATDTDAANTDDDFSDNEYDILPETVVIHSIDADGCFLPHFRKNLFHRTMAQHNSQFFSELLKSAKEIQGYTIILSGSARQGCLRDLLGMLQYDHYCCFTTDSYFFALEKFVRDINIKLAPENQVILDGFLLDDVCFDRPSGDTFKEALKYGREWSKIIRSPLNLENEFDKIKQEMVACAMNAIEQQKKEWRQKHHFFWESFGRFPLSEHPGKFALLYAQTHHIASQSFSIDKQLHFHFYDDRLDILWPLVAVFLHASELLPKNMTLYFHHYMRGQQLCNPKNNAPVVQEVKGTGVVDFHYRETLQDMASKLNVEKMREWEIQLRSGNPLDYFFKIVWQGDFNSHQFLPPAVTVFKRDTFAQFNEDRLIRLGVIKERSFTGFFAEMRKLDLALANDGQQEGSSEF